MVCDLQGVRKNDGVYILTDPVVLSCTGANGDPKLLENGRKEFGSTDVGTSGMTRFFKNHKCNLYCQKLSICDSNKRRQSLDQGGPRAKKKRLAYI